MAERSCRENHHWDHRRFLTSRSASLLLIGLLILTSCAGVTAAEDDVGIAANSDGNAATFCRGWDEVRQTLIDTIEGQEERLEWFESARALDAHMAEFDRYAPPDIRSEWATAYDAYTKLSDIRFTTGGATRPEHLTMMFGPAGAGPLLAQAMTAIAAIDEWSLVNCGDFCSRWPGFRRFFSSDPEEFRWNRYEPHLERERAQIRASMQAGYLLVPEDLEKHWTPAAELTLGVLDMADSWSSSDWPEDEEREEAFRDWMGVEWDHADHAANEGIRAIDEWAEGNCESEPGTVGEPGTLQLRYMPSEHLSGHMIFAALLPAGTSFETLQSTDRYLGVSCGEVSESPEQMEENLEWMKEMAREQGQTLEEALDEQWHWNGLLHPLREQGEYHESICGLLRHESELVVPGGQYELFIGTYIGDPGSYDLYFAAANHCAQTTIVIDGDTTIEVSDLEECTLPPRGDPEEIIRREPAPDGEGGSLYIEYATLAVPGGFDGCHMRATLLPSGTTLNNIGTGDVWPLGGSTMGLMGRWWIEESLEPGAELQSGRVPILRVSPNAGIPNLPHQIDSDGVWDSAFPPPMPLDPGTYDLRISRECGNEDEEHEAWQFECAFVSVDVAGDTVVAVPEFGPCP